MANNVAQTKDAHFALRMPSQTMHTLKAAAVQDGRSASAYALRVIQAHLAAMVADGRLTV